MMSDEIRLEPFSYDDLSIERNFELLAREVESSRTNYDLEAFRLHWLGRKQGRLKLLSEAWLQSAPAEARKPLGMRFNQ